MPDVASPGAPVVVHALGVSRGWLLSERELRGEVECRRGMFAGQRSERVPLRGRASDAPLRGRLSTLRAEGCGLRIENADFTDGLTVDYGREHEASS